MSKKTRASKKAHSKSKSNKKPNVIRSPIKSIDELSRRINKAKKSPTKGKFKTIIAKKVLRSSST